jgi:hypothetical protein
MATIPFFFFAFFVGWHLQLALSQDIIHVGPVEPDAPAPQRGTVYGPTILTADAPYGSYYAGSSVAWCLQTLANVANCLQYAIYYCYSCGREYVKPQCAYTAISVAYSCPGSTQQLTVSANTNMYPDYTKYITLAQCDALTTCPTGKYNVFGTAACDQCPIGESFIAAPAGKREESNNNSYPKFIFSFEVHACTYCIVHAYHSRMHAYKHKNSCMRAY